VQKHILHIELVNRPGVRDNQGKHGADCGRVDHQVEGLIIVDTGSLGEATKNPASLVPVQGAVGIELLLENPLAGDEVGANRMRGKCHTPFRDSGNEASIRVSRMFSSHV
jgi:hypothetical protein